MSQLAIIPELQERIALYEDMKAYAQLYDLLYDGLFRFTRSIVKSSEAAEEIVSDVFIKVWQIRSMLQEIENLRVYLFTIAKNFSLNYLTKNYKNVTVSLESIDVQADLSIESEGPVEMCISADAIRQIRNAIQCLPPQCRLILQLVREEGLKYKEVADILDISPLTVRNQLAIAVRKMADLLPSSLRSQIYFSNKFSRS